MELNFTNPNLVSAEKIADGRNYSAQLRNMADAIDGNLRLFARLREIIPDFSNETVLAIGTHRLVLSQFLYADCKHFSSVEKAVSAATQDDILMYITEICLYGVFTPKNYMEFITNVRSNSDEDNITYHPKQIMLSGFPQRIAFMCAGDQKFIDRIKYYCEIYFKSKVQINTDGDKTDIVVQAPIVKNLSESQSAFANFFSFINTKEKVSALQIAQEIHHTRDAAYMVSTLGDHMRAVVVDDLLERLGSFPGIINIYVNNGTMYVNNNCGNRDEKAAVKDWIRNNPPANREKKVDYYAKYKNSVEVPVVDTVFGKIMKELGYGTRKTANSREWVRN